MHWCTGPPTGCAAISRRAARRTDATDELTRALGDVDVEAFWQRAKTKLQAGKLRLVFVADEIPSELRRVVEFLNAQMDPAEVLAGEVRQYVGQNLRTLVPTVLGQTAESQQRKGTASRAAGTWDEERFMAKLAERRGREATDVARRILEWIDRRGLRLTWGKGAQDGSFVPVLEYGSARLSVFAVYTTGGLEVNFQYYMEKPPFSDEGLRRELLQRLNAVPAVSIPEDALRRRPNVPLASLAAPGALEGVLSTFDWMIATIRERAGGGES